jgi:hypothetical protein
MEKIIPKILPMSPYEVYLQRVNATYDGIRKTRQGLTYTPAQFGGLFGQGAVANGGYVLELTEFEIS